MRVTSRTFHPARGWSDPLPDTPSPETALVLAFGPAQAPDGDWFAALRTAWPAARVVYVTGGGQMVDGHVRDEETVVTAIRFAATRVQAVALDGVGVVPCEQLGSELGRALATVAELRHVLVFCDGLALNGSAFVRGLARAVPSGVGISGGLASDGPAFVQTGVGLDGPPVAGRVVAIGLAGAGLTVSAGSAGGWDDFGPDRRVTRAVGATVYTLDDEPALAVYRRYLGAFAAELPGSALLFPLALRDAASDTPTVRTILGIDEAEGALRFAGEVPEGALVRLMRADTERLLDGAGEAARRARRGVSDEAAALALCVSCIGRRAVLRSRVDEELDEVRNEVGPAVLLGFYGNGEIGPLGSTSSAATLHNQTMTVTLLAER